MSLANEEAMMLIIPAARAAVSKILKKEQGMTQAEISKILGTTQAAVSKYLNGNYSAKIKALEKKIDSSGISASIAKGVAAGATRAEVSADLDGIARHNSILRAALKLTGKQGGC